MATDSPLNVIAVVVFAVAVLAGRARARRWLFSRGLGIVALVLAAVDAFEPGLAPGSGRAASPGGKGGV
jgi:hypothetical protein